MAEKQKSKDIILQTPKGTKDILPEEYYFYEDFLNKAEDVAKYYGFLPVQTPHLEKIELFTTTVGEATDIVEKQMYTLRTRGGDRLVLRPEGTASVVRAYLKHGMHTRPQPVMLYYKGSFFRHESPQFGRLREFQQFGLEILGEEGAIADATTIKVAGAILEEAGLKKIVVRLNSIGDKECRGIYRKDLLNYYRRKFNHLCRDCGRRLKENPLRLLDCKEKTCLELKQGAPQMINYLCPECKQHFKEILETLDNLNISYLLDNYLVRGLDYYSRTVFEIFSEEEAKTEEK
jgi:histidyl-tRNA synthetase